MIAAMMAGVLDHLWQSSLFAAGAGLVTLLLGANAARVRFWLWFAASVKFLVPFAAIGALAVWLLPAPQVSMPALHVLAPVLRPFPAAPVAAPALPAPVPAVVVQGSVVQGSARAIAVLPANAPGFDWTLVVVALWALGSLGIAFHWLRRWRGLRAVLRQARSLPSAAHGPVRVSSSLLEPGLFGLWRPVIMVPQGIDRELSAAELDAILVHEACHRDHCDNLLAAVHMLVEALFWFYPLVWWLGARLNRERERACDEAVLAKGTAAQVYAESILKVCRLYLQSSLDCIAGVSGADLKTRVEWIVRDRVPLKLSALRKLMLAGLGAASLAVPVLGSLAMLPAAVQAQSPAPQAEVDTPARIAERRSEQSVPRKVVAFNPADFDKFTGSYEFNALSVMTVTRDGGHYLAQLTGQQPVEFFPESQSKFFTTTIQIPAQISFTSGAGGRVTELVLHQGGFEQHAPRISAAEATKLQDAMMAHIRSNAPAPGTESSLRRYIASLEKGSPNYNEMVWPLDASVRNSLPSLLPQMAQWGALQSITFRNVDGGGRDVYDVVFAHGKAAWHVAPLTADGKVYQRFVQMIP